jgi:uroporphyrinogen III methyltransferase/synthase
MPAVATEPGAGLATVLDGLGGAPARPGVVHVVGVGRRDVGQGPADPATLTLRAAVLIASVDHLVVEPGAAPDVLALARPDATVSDLDAFLDHRSDVGPVLPDGSVAVLLAGDPTERGRAAVVAGTARAAGREVEVAAAVGPTRAALAAAGVSVPPPRSGDERPVTVIAHDVPPLDDLSEQLRADGWPGSAPALLIDGPATPRQRTTETTVDGLAGQRPRGGVVVVVGTDQHLPWRRDLPLAGVSVLVPRATAQASRLSMRIRSLGGEPVEAPTITIEPGDDAALRGALRDLADGAFTAVCFTSPNGVDAVAAAMDVAGLDARVFAQVATVACVGPGTAARLHQRLHVRADLVPPVATTVSLAQAFPPGEGRVLLPRADIATNLLHDELVAGGYRPVEVAAYVTGTPDGLPAEVLRRLERGDIEQIAFASSSTARNFVALVGDRPWRGDVVSIGPVTSATCTELGVPVAVEADPHDLDGLVDALCIAAARRGG